MTLVVVVSYGVMRALLQLLGFGWRHLGFLYTALTSYLNPCRGGGGTFDLGTLFTLTTRYASAEVEDVV